MKGKTFLCEKYQYKFFLYLLNSFKTKSKQFKLLIKKIL